MSEPLAVIVPLLNPNEPQALLALLHVRPGERVTQGTLLCTLETTKSTQELLAERDGYVAGLAFEAGQSVPAGAVLCYLAASPDWTPPARLHVAAEPVKAAITGLRISQPALQLVEQHHLDLSTFPTDRFITESLVQEQLDRTASQVLPLKDAAYGPASIIVYGGGGHGKALIDLIRLEGSFGIAGIVDDGLPAGSLLMGVPVLGGSAILGQLLERGIQLAANAVGGIGNIDSRIRVFERLQQAGFTCPSLVHPSAVVEPSATLSDGVQVMPLAYVGSEAHVGYGVIVNTGAIVSHDCCIGNYANLSPGAILAGEVDIGEASLVGMGVTINLRVKVGDRARIGNGATVKTDVPEGSIVHAGSLWPV